MAQNITLLGANYPDVPAVELPKTGGGTASFTDVTDSNVTVESMLSGTTAYNASGVKITGSIQSQVAQTIIPTTVDQTIASGKYLSGIQTIKGDANLLAENIADGVTIFGVTGTHKGGSTTIPDFTYTGTYSIIDDGDDGWRIKFLTSGVFSITDIKGGSLFDVFAVGGGGGGGGWPGRNNQNAGGSGGGGGYTNTVTVPLLENTNYSVTVGAGGAKGAWGATGSAGGASSFGSLLTVNGGSGGTYYSAGGNGGSGGGSGGNSANGGDGGSDGSNGVRTSRDGGTGQTVTTREFGESTGTLYAGGGGGGRGNSSGKIAGVGGSGGGGNGGGYYQHGYGGVINTGGGGGGAGAAGECYTTGGAGGSGIVIIRNSRQQ